MKCPRQISMPSGIQLWLEEQLEARGIDAAIYSKYILTVLCNNSSDPSSRPKDSGVKSLVDELKAKLKIVQEKGLFPQSDLAPPKSFEDSKPQSLQEKAVRYYTAFPPLSSKSKTDPNNHSPIGSSSSVWSGKRAFGSSIGKNRTFSEGNNRDFKFNNRFNWLEENKENNSCNRDVREKMRSRSTVKQQKPDKSYRNMAKSLDRKDDFDRKVEMSKSRRLYQPSDVLASDRVQALWSSEKSFEDLTGCDQDLPMDFQQLLESPEATKISPDFSRCIGTKQQSSFIQCGTNITSSIWSEKAEDNIMDSSMVGDASTDFSLSLNFNKSVWGTSNDNSHNRPEGIPDSGSHQSSDVWSTGERNVFNDDSWKAVGHVDTKEPFVDFGKWSDVEGTSLLLNDSDNFFSSIGSNHLHNSLTTLNHNKEDSSFTEVIPKVSGTAFNTANDMMTTEPVVNRSEGTTSKKEEEDLLTSMKTHFRPIKQETVEIVKSTTAPIFPDGTTFSISNKLDEPIFHKSPGGGLYLDSDMNNKYLEFNEAKTNSKNKFVPKYRVRQNEKFCQTEELPPQNYVDPDGEELYFPEDEEMVRNMIEEDEVGEEEEKTFWGGAEPCIKVDGWMATWPATGIWSNEPNIQQIWCGGNVWNSANDSAETEKPNEGKEGDQYTQLYNEWTQEAEELLSDISQHLCLANYMDTQPPKLVEVEPKASEPVVVVRGVSRDRKRRHWSSQLGANCPGASRSRPLTL